MGVSLGSAPTSARYSAPKATRLALRYARPTGRVRNRILVWGRTHASLTSARLWGRVGSHQRGLSEEAERTAVVAEILYGGQQLR